MSFLRFRIFFTSSRSLLNNSPLSSCLNSSKACLSLLSETNNCKESYNTKTFGILLNHDSRRFLAKNKDKKKESKKSTGLELPKVVLDDEDMEKVYDYENFRTEIQAIIEDYKTNLRENFNVRLNPRQIEKIEVSYEGTIVRIADLTTVTRKQNDIILNLEPTPNMVKPVMNAILESGLNLNPQIDGHVIYIQMTKITTERREALIKSVRQLATKIKDQIKDRNLHKKFQHKDISKISKDTVNYAQANLNYYIKKNMMIIDEIAATKIESLKSN